MEHARLVQLIWRQGRLTSSLMICSPLAASLNLQTECPLKQVTTVHIVGDHAGVGAVTEHSGLRSCSAITHRGFQDAFTPIGAAPEG
eukprot:5493829-Amphidinium_carterae.1